MAATQDVLGVGLTLGTEFAQEDVVEPKGCYYLTADNTVFFSRGGSQADMQQDPTDNTWDRVDNYDCRDASGCMCAKSRPPHVVPRTRTEKYRIRTLVIYVHAKCEDMHSALG